MIRSAIAALLLAVVACSGVPARVQPARNERAAECTTVLLHHRSHLPRCAAVAVGPRSMLTALHCLTAGTFVSYTDRSVGGAEPKAAWLERSDPSNDLALLKTLHTLPAWSRIRTTHPNLGEELCAVHHAQGLPYQFACGVVTEPEYDTRTTDVDPNQEIITYRTTIDVLPGASGSGLWDASGNLVGISISYDLETHDGMYARADALRAIVGEK